MKFRYVTKLEKLPSCFQAKHCNDGLMRKSKLEYTVARK